MILRLAREQLRSGRRYTAWSALLLTMAVALASTAFVGAYTQIATANLTSQAVMPRLDHVAWVSWWTNGLPAGDPLDRSLASQPNVLAPGELEAMVDAARSSGDDAIANHRTSVWIERAADGQGGHPVELTSRYPAVSWDDVLVEGRAPGAGEVVLATHVADRLGIAVGDQVRLASPAESDHILGGSVTVAGVTRPSARGLFVSPAPAGYVTWNDGLDYDATVAPWWDVAVDTGEPTQRLEATVAWREGAAAFAELEPIDIDDFTFDDLPLHLQGWPAATFAAAGLVALAMIGATIGMARSQAQRRIQWVATARVLGARRSTLAAASAAEAAVIGAAATAGGIALGYLGVAGLMAFARWRTSGVLLPSVPVLTPVALALLIVLGLLLAAITAVAPAFWATRVAPVAALKPVTPFSEAQVSRDVSGRWLIALVAVAVAGVVTGAASGAFDESNLGQLLEVFGVAAVAVIGIAVVTEHSRHGVRVAARLVARLRQPWAAAVESALTARVRSSGTAAAVVGLTAAGIVSVIALGAYNAAFGTSAASLEGMVAPASEWAWRRATPTWAIAGVMVGAFTLAAVVVAAITSTARHATAGNDAVQSALGLSPADARTAAGVEMAIPLVLGALVGSSVGWAASALVALTGLTHLDGSGEPWAAAAAATLVTVAVTVMIASLVAMVASCLAAIGTRTGTPVRELARSSR